MIKLKDLSEDEDFDVLECMINMLEDGEVVVPYPLTLTKAMDKTVLRSRNDYDKIITLIKLRTWYHQRQRQYFIAADGKTKVWIATPEDAIKSLELASKVLKTIRKEAVSSSELEKEAEAFLALLR